MESNDEHEDPEEMDVTVEEMTKLKHLVSCKVLTKPPKDHKPPSFTRRFILSKPAQNKAYYFDLTKADALFDKMILQKAIETPHKMPKLEELNVKQYCKLHNS